MAALSASQATHWRSSGPYLPTIASKAALLEETRLFLVALGQHNLETTSQILLDTTLVQRSRETRKTILEIIRTRLVRWNPPAWVQHDLVSFANEASLEALRAALLLHVPRQDRVLYDFVQEVVFPRWHSGESQITVADVQKFFDATQADHPEIARWSFETRLRLARGMLATLRDYGLLKGTVQKQVVLPVIPEQVVQHAIRLLDAEGIAQTQMADHPDWCVWLWSPAQAQVAIERFFKQEHIG
ncbi:MAG: BrxA family protein [Ktedonobacteraceae bacterium]